MSEKYRRMVAAQRSGFNFVSSLVESPSIGNWPFLGNLQFPFLVESLFVLIRPNHHSQLLVTWLLMTQKPVSNSVLEKYRRMVAVMVHNAN